MKKLILKIFMLALCIVFSIYIFIFLIPNDKDSYLMALEDKINYLKDSGNPKMVFIGGSNLAFGLDSNEIEKEFNLDVINTGLHAGLGLRFMINSIKPYINTNDIIVISPEYEQFTTNLNGDSTLVELIGMSPEFINVLDSNNIMAIVSNVNHLSNILKNKVIMSMRKILKRDHVIKNVYSRTGFNANGDLISNLGELNIEKISLYDDFGDFNSETIPFLNEFYEFCSKQNVQVYMTFPCLYDKQYEKWEEEIFNLIEILNDNDFKIPIISIPKDYIFGESEMYDTIYHLNALGIKVRTNKIINDLDKVIIRTN